MNNARVYIRKLLKEVNEIPEEKLPDLLTFIRYLKIGFIHERGTRPERASEPIAKSNAIKRVWLDDADEQTQRFLALCGSWEDSRTSDEIVTDIYNSRSASRNDIEL